MTWPAATLLSTRLALVMSTQIGNVSNGDIAARDIHKTIIEARHLTPMAKLVEQYRSETESDQTLSSLIERLEHFFSNQTTSDVRGLEEKLQSSKRADLLQEALLKKQAAYKLIMRNQGSKSAQSIFAFVLADIVVSFEQVVRPLVQAGASRIDVDKAVLEQVIAPVLSGLEDNPLVLNKLDIQGLLYFLAGNCHLRWDPC